MVYGLASKLNPLVSDDILAFLCTTSWRCSSVMLYSVLFYSCTCFVKPGCIQNHWYNEAFLICTDLTILQPVSNNAPMSQHFPLSCLRPMCSFMWRCVLGLIDHPRKPQRKSDSTNRMPHVLLFIPSSMNYFGGGGCLTPLFLSCSLPSAQTSDRTKLTPGEQWNECISG